MIRPLTTTSCAPPALPATRSGPSNDQFVVPDPPVVRVEKPPREPVEAETLAPLQAAVPEAPPAFNRLPFHAPLPAKLVL